MLVNTQDTVANTHYLECHAMKLHGPTLLWTVIQHCQTQPKDTAGSFRLKWPKIRKSRRVTISDFNETSLMCATM